MKPVTGSWQLTQLNLEGYKSIQNCELELGALNLFVGANGAGKSNLIGFFKLIRDLIDGNLQVHVAKAGGPDALLHFGRKVTERLTAQLYFGNNGYWVTLEPTVDNRLMFANEAFWWNMSGAHSIGSGHFESTCRSGTRTGIDRYVLPALEIWSVYHFHDTSDEARVKQPHAINDNSYLRPDARNLAAYLHRLKGTERPYYDRIVRAIQLAAPFFGDFHLRPRPANKDVIELACAGGQLYQRVACLEQAFANDVGCENFIPYLSVHEFEVLLFSDPSKFSSWFDDHGSLQQLTASVIGFENPEHINDGPDTAPSKRVEVALGGAGYQKPVHGPLIAMDVGLERMREQCPHFGQWVMLLEDLAS